jgi:hypothetical protein
MHMLLRAGLLHAAFSLRAACPSIPTTVPDYYRMQYDDDDDDDDHAEEEEE